MFEFLKASHPQNARASGAQPDSVPAQTAPQYTNTNRKLVHMVFKDTLRVHGIPVDWLACETIIVPRGLATEELHIHLVVMKWNESLLRYASALQLQLLSGLDRFEPSVDHSKYVISWRFSPACACPVNLMPEPNFWVQETQSSDVEEYPSILDWPKSKWREPASIYSSDVPDGQGKNEDDDYERTRLSPLVRDDGQGKSDDDDYERTKLSPLR
jgi:hypothetical protein